MGLDAGYLTPQLCKGIIEGELLRVMGYKRPTHRDGYFYKREYRYNREQNCYYCPAGEMLRYRTTNRLGCRGYVSDRASYAEYPYRAQCT